jgi:hypothetical protein
MQMIVRLNPASKKLSLLFDAFSSREPVSTSPENAIVNNPTGKSVNSLSSPLCKNILVFRKPKSLLYPSLSRPTEGRHAIVTAAGRDAVDADAPITNGAGADGEVVWS